MLRLIAISFSFTYLLLADENKLTDAQREALLSKIEHMEKAVIESDASLQSKAIGTFINAAQSDSSAYELFEQCRRIIVYEQEKRDDSDARDSERYLDDALSDEFKRSLRHQLYWLAHSLEARRNAGSRLDQAKKLVDGLGNIVKDADELNYEIIFNQPIPGYALDEKHNKDRQRQAQVQKGVVGDNTISPLYQDPFESVFAKAYKVDHLRPTSWPKHPMDFDGLYGGVILYELIEQKDYSNARKQWDDRIKGEATLHKIFGVGSNNKGDTPASYDKFMIYTVPDLQWKSEQQLYTGGDEVKSSSNMYELLKNNATHPKYMDWSKWLVGSLKTK